MFKCIICGKKYLELWAFWCSSNDFFCLIDILDEWWNPQIWGFLPQRTGDLEKECGAGPLWPEFLDFVQKLNRSVKQTQSKNLGSNSLQLQEKNKPQSSDNIYLSVVLVHQWKHSILMLFFLIFSCHFKISKSKVWIL